MAKKQSFWFSSNGLAALTLIGAVSYFLFMEHREHLFQFLPFLILLLCPLMHIFMHGGMVKGVTESMGEDGYQKGYEDGLRDRNEQEKNHQLIV